MGFSAQSLRNKLHEKTTRPSQRVEILLLEQQRYPSS